MDFDQHRGAELTHFHPSHTGSLQSLGEMLNERRGNVRPSRVDKAGSPALSTIGVQSKLGDNQRLAIHIQERKVSLALVVGKDAQVGDLVRQPLRDCLVVTVSRAQENDQARSDFTYRPAFNGKSPGARAGPQLA